MKYLGKYWAEEEGEMNMEKDTQICLCVRLSMY